MKTMVQFRDAGSPLESAILGVRECLGIDMLGFCDLRTVHSCSEHLSKPVVSGFPAAVSLGVRLLDGVINGLPNHNDVGTLNLYRAHYRAVNALLDRAALSIAQKIEGFGYLALPIPATDDESNAQDTLNLSAEFSHKLAASRAGLGWIGRSCLLVTPRHGPRVRLATVLTDAQLTPGAPIEQECGDCRACADICPAGAITGRSFRSNEERELRLDAHACDAYMADRQERLGEGLCGLCVFCCPYGRKKDDRGSRDGR